ncbi:MAG: acyl-CoA thioesterase [Planctomycetota bacterium]
MTLRPVTLRPSTRAVDHAVFGVDHPRPAVFEIDIDQSSISEEVPHVNNIEYLRWFDRAAELHGDAVGYPREALLEHDCMWFVARHEVDYQAEAWPDDDLRLITWVRDMRRVKSWRDAVVVRESDATIIARASTLWVLVNLTSRRPMRVPMTMAAAFEPLDRLAEQSVEPPACT